MSVFVEIFSNISTNVTRGNDGLTESLREFCSSKSRGKLETPLRNYCLYLAVCDTHNYCGMRIDKRILDMLDKNKVSYQNQSKLSTLLSNDFGLKN